MKGGPTICSSEALAVVRQGRVDKLFLTSLKLSSTNARKGSKPVLAQMTPWATAE